MIWNRLLIWIDGRLERRMGPDEWLASQSWKGTWAFLVHEYGKKKLAWWAIENVLMLTLGIILLINVVRWMW